MKRILISALLVTIISCQNKTTEKSADIELKKENPFNVKLDGKDDSETETEKQGNERKIAEFKSENNLKILSQKNFNFIIANLLKDDYGLANFHYLDFDKINTEEWNSEITKSPINKMDERVINKNFIVFEFNYGTDTSLRQKYFLNENDIIKEIDFKFNKEEEQKLNIFLEKIAGKNFIFDTTKLQGITRSKDNVYEIEFDLLNETKEKSYSIKYKTKDFKSIIANSLKKV